MRVSVGGGEGIQALGCIDATSGHWQEPEGTGSDFL